MLSLKDQILQVAEALPDDATLDDFRYRLYLQLKAREGLEAIEKGDVYTRDEVAQQIHQWRKSSGPDQP